MLRRAAISLWKASLRPPPPALIPTEPPSLLIPRAGVSGTAKGKGKLKSGQPLKRSKITKKKGAAAPPPSEGRGRGGEAERLRRLAESCLNAPTPIRYLTEKQRRREAEREKLGLISKERQRELDMAKAKSKKKEGSDGAPATPPWTRESWIGTPGLDPISLGLIDEKDLIKYELTVEDGRRLAKEYSRVLMRKTRARQAAESTLLKLKKEAIAALPDHLREAALVPDLTPFPANRYMATLTPPIQGYVDKIREAAQKHVVKEKLR
ncbi:uncharacterized protein LOC116253856 [Nymphaea colorata]|nr:uncharacterized protein LOC116253856 [Nymphaea colorata]